MNGYNLNEIERKIFHFYKLSHNLVEKVYHAKVVKQF